MSFIEFKHIGKKYAGAEHKSVDDFNLNIEEKEFIAFVGPSGCGKSTTLRMIAGFEEITEGDLYIDGKRVNETAPRDRGIAMVFQNYALYPHMTVEKNIAVVPEILGWDSAQIHDRVTELLELVNLDPKQYRGRYPSQLSGGQQQRVGLARALAAKPSLMLLDEPFGAIDAINRTKLQDELMKIHKRAGLTCMFVTHDVTEALKLGTRIMIMNQGKIQQFDTAKNILEYPANAYVASLLQSVQEGLNFFR